MRFLIQKELFDLLPDLTIGVIIARGIDNTRASVEIERLLVEAIEGIRESFGAEKVQEHPRIKPWRSTFSKLGISGSKFPSSIESMARRILKGDPFPRINPLVDLYNSVSLKFVVPMGGHDLDTLDGDIRLQFAEGWEPFMPMGGGEKVVVPLSGLKVACYYGCLSVRPPGITGVNRYEDPDHMDRLMSTLGAEPLPWSYKADCCGASLVMARTDIVRRLSHRLLEMAKEAEADCLVTGCTMCQSNLDTRQEEISKEFGQSYDLPIFYFTELIGLAMGHRDVKKWLGRHLTDPMRLLSSKGLIK